MLGRVSRQREMAHDKNHQILQGRKEARLKWVEYFEQVLIVEYDLEVNIIVAGDMRMNNIARESTGSAMNEIKAGKEHGLDGFAVE